MLCRCVTPSVNESLYDTLRSNDISWIDHYHKDKCGTKSILPTATHFSWENNQNDDADGGPGTCSRNNLPSDPLHAFKFSKGYQESDKEGKGGIDLVLRLVFGYIRSS